VTAAVEGTLARPVADADAVRRRLEGAGDRRAASFDLTGRPQRWAVRGPPPDLAAYGALTSGKGVQR
jgi:hypothetical protein